MTGTVAVVGYRNRIDPPELGDCGDPDCRTIAVVSSDQLVGRDLLLVASYSTATIDTLRDHETLRVCGACDGRRLGAWLRGESEIDLRPDGTRYPPCSTCGLDPSHPAHGAMPLGGHTYMASAGG